MKPRENITEVLICDNDESKVLKIGFQLDEQHKEALIHFMKANLNVFPWKHSDMVGISSSMCHRLNVSPNYKPIRQKRKSIDVDETPLKRAWNGEHLKKYYQ